MNYRNLGRTGLVVSEVGFGAWGIGGRTVSRTKDVELVMVQVDRDRVVGLVGRALRPQLWSGEHEQ